MEIFSFLKNNTKGSVCYCVQFIGLGFLIFFFCDPESFSTDYTCFGWSKRPCKTKWIQTIVSEDNKDSYLQHLQDLPSGLKYISTVNTHCAVYLPFLYMFVLKMPPQGGKFHWIAFKRCLSISVLKVLNLSVTL